jgi:sulfoxide reductase heme-binding subunit YedZ
MSTVATAVAASPSLAGHMWWIASRAAGLVALGLVTASVILGLTQAGRLTRRPAVRRRLAALHEQLAVTGLVAIAVHGVTLLGDAWLSPGVSGIAVPFTMAYKPLFTGLGIIGGYLAAILGLSFYIRRRIGPRLWRKAHQLTIVVYALAVVHTLGAGTDATTPWLRWWIAITAPTILVLFVARVRAGIEAGRAKADRGSRPELATRREALGEEAS